MNLKLAAAIVVCVSVPILCLLVLRDGEGQSSDTRDLEARVGALVQPQPTPEAGPRSRAREEEPRAGLDGTVAVRHESPDETSRDLPADSSLQLFYLQERTRCWATFLTDAPDTQGWNKFMGLIADDCMLDASSFDDTDEGTIFSCSVPGTDVSVSCALDDSGRGRVSYTGTAELEGVGLVQVIATAIFHESDGTIPIAESTIQFKSKDGKPYREDGHAGCVYSTDESKDSFRFVHWEKDKSKYWLVVPADTDVQQKDGGGLGWAYTWMRRLKEARRARQSGVASGSSK